MIIDRNRQSTTPIRVPRTKRNHNLTVLTSLQAGKMMPLAAIPLLREDEVKRGTYSATFELHETVEVLMNPVHMVVSAYLVPWSASDRFEGSMDQFNRSYKGQPQIEGGSVEPFIELETLGEDGVTDCEIYTYLGLHGSSGDKVATWYKEAYNLIWNYRAKNRSAEITLADRLNDELLPAFWTSSRFSHIVPDFDQAKMEGAIPITFLEPRIPVRGFGVRASGAASDDVQVYEWEAPGSGIPNQKIYPKSVEVGTTNDAGKTRMQVRLDPSSLLPDIFAELQEDGIELSLANIDVAKKTRALARLREQYQGIDEEWVIDMLMDGLTIPDQQFMQPIFLGQQDTVFQFGKRYSTDADNLDAHVVNGVARVNMTFRTPRVPTGGTIMIVAELVPEQLFERQQDPLFHIQDVDALPDFIRDDTNPEKVVEVFNDYIDTDHETPNGLFGYAPLNHEFAMFGPKIGGRFHRPDVDAVEDTDRQRLWAVEAKNPKLAENFYIVSEIHTKPFLHPDEDPADVVLLGNVAIEGRTVFGGMLIEASDDYSTIMEKVPMDRIEKA